MKKKVDGRLKGISKEMPKGQVTKQAKEQVAKLLEAGSGIAQTWIKRQPKELSPKHKEIIALHVQGMKEGKIAERVGYSRDTVTMVCHCPLGLAYAAELREDLEEATRYRVLASLSAAMQAKLMLRLEAPDIAQILLGAAQGIQDISQTKLSAVNSVLDRAGVKEERPVEIKVGVMVGEDSAKDMDGYLNEVSKPVEVGAGNE